jgi:hypothetical protein
MNTLYFHEDINGRKKIKFSSIALHEFIIPEERTGYSPKDEFKRTGSRDEMQIF